MKHLKKRPPLNYRLLTWDRHIHTEYYMDTNRNTNITKTQSGHGFVIVHPTTKRQ